MTYLATCGSDVGRVKDINQDALAVKQVRINGKEIIFAILCDGMGGFEQGELASTSVVIAYVNWFNNVFLNNIQKMNEGQICADWDELMRKMNIVLFDYGSKNEIKLGTTLTVLLIWNDMYYIYNVGDGRVYELKDNIMQITKDHSWVAREVEEGRMTAEEARTDKRKNRILRCVGGAPKTLGDFFTGKIPGEVVYMLCCDGVRNKVSDEELLYFFHPSCMTTIQSIDNNIKYIFELNKIRNERDNMSLIVIRDNDTTLNLSNIGNGIENIYEKIIIGTNKYISV